MIGPEVPRTRGMKLMLATSIVTNLGLLAVFKYTGFVAENINALGALLGSSKQLVPVLHVVLPVGISFYTFKAMSYAIDVYRGDARPMRRFTDYMCFEAFFPGPGRRPHHSLRGARRADARAAAHARQIRARRGVLLARHGARRSCSPTRWGTSPTPPLRPAPSTLTTLGSGLIGYAFQIYFDFSGYSDMAVGLALMLGFVLIQNFDSPYKSRSITEFWRRWHISLSTWLRDYLYIPLGGNRKGPVRTYVNLMTVMLLRRPVARSELELRDLGRHSRRHAGARTQARQSSPAADGCRPSVSVAFTFLIVCLSWVFFRAKTLGQARQLSGLTVRAERGVGGVERRLGRALPALLPRLVRAVRRRRLRHAEQLGAHGALVLAADRVRDDRDGAGDADDVDADHQPLPLLSVLRPLDAKHLVGSLCDARARRAHGPRARRAAASWHHRDRGDSPRGVAAHAAVFGRHLRAAACRKPISKSVRARTRRSRSCSSARRLPRICARSRRTSRMPRTRKLGFNRALSFGSRASVG